MHLRLYACLNIETFVLLLLSVCMQACKKHKITPGVFCLGEDRAARLSAMGFVNIAYGTDTGSLMDFVDGMQKRLQAAAAAQ